MCRQGRQSSDQNIQLEICSHIGVACVVEAGSHQIKTSSLGYAATLVLHVSSRVVLVRWMKAVERQYININLATMTGSPDIGSGFGGDDITVTCLRSMNYCHDIQG
jgi:hypothetical protein